MISDPYFNYSCRTQTGLEDVKSYFVIPCLRGFLIAVGQGAFFLSPALEQ